MTIHDFYRKGKVIYCEYEIPGLEIQNTEIHQLELIEFHAERSGEVDYYHSLDLIYVDSGLVEVLWDCGIRTEQPRYNWYTVEEWLQEFLDDDLLADFISDFIARL